MGGLQPDKCVNNSEKQVPEEWIRQDNLHLLVPMSPDAVTSEVPHWDAVMLHCDVQFVKRNQSLPAYRGMHAFKGGRLQHGRFWMDDKQAMRVNLNEPVFVAADSAQWLTAALHPCNGASPSFTQQRPFLLMFAQRCVCVRAFAVLNVLHGVVWCGVVWLCVCLCVCERARVCGWVGCVVTVLSVLVPSWLMIRCVSFPHGSMTNKGGPNVSLRCVHDVWLM